MDQDRKAAAPPSSPTPDNGGAAFGPGNNVGQSPKKRKNWLRFAVRALASCVLLCVLVIAGALVALRNEGVQGWLTDKINAALEAAPPDLGSAQGSAAGADGATPAIRATRFLTPRLVVDRHIPFVAFFLIFWLWILLAYVRQGLCRIDGCA